MLPLASMAASVKADPLRGSITPEVSDTLTLARYRKAMTPFAEALRRWRKARRYSQLELADRADVSTRHLAFLETGRSNPSRQMIMRLGDALDLPLSARNQLLTQAGFAVRYPGRNWSSDDMAPVRTAVDYMLARHGPFPALAMDRMWTVQQLNLPAKLLFGALGIEEGANLVAFIRRKDIQAMIENWPQVAHQTAQRLRTESASCGGVAEFEAAADELQQSAAPFGPGGGPVAPTIYRAGDRRLSLFAVIAQFGTPEDLTLDDLRIELFFPADSETEAYLRELDRDASMA